MALRIVINTRQAGPRFERSMRRNGAAVREAMRATASEAAVQIMDEGRTDISQAGNFGARWTEGFRATVGEGGGHIRVSVTMGVPYWTVFQFGKVIQGRPLLWIPLSFATDAQGVMARDYPGPLFRVDRAGKAPLLMTNVGKRAEAKYFGKESVNIPKKFHLIEICARIGRGLAEMYRGQFRRIMKNG